MQIQFFGSDPREILGAKHLINRIFTDVVEKQPRMKAAPEALVVFGSGFNGFKAPNRRYTPVELKDKIYTL